MLCGVNYRGEPQGKGAMGANDDEGTKDEGEGEDDGNCGTRIECDNARIFFIGPSAMR